MKSKMRIWNIFLFLVFCMLLKKTESQINYGLLESISRIFFTERIPDRQTLQAEYDFIIIGSGSAGSVMAGRLSEIKEWDVLLLEAGGEETILSEIPLAAPLNQQSGLSWGYKAVKSTKYCTGLLDGLCDCARGRGLGGSSIINYMVYTRGSPGDYDEWEANGNPGWGYKDLLKYFKKLENVNIPQYRKTDIRGKDGPITVEESSYQSKLLDHFIRAGQDLGYKHQDPNGEEQLGFSKIQGSIRNGRRCSASKGYIRPNVKRTNLHISLKSWVTKIFFDPKTMKATAVQYIRNRKKHIVRAKKEIILSAGAFASAQLLMLSGVGPADHLKEMDIPLVKDLKVGYNAQDQFSLPGLAFTINDSSLTLDPSILTNPNNAIEFFTQGKGPYTLPGGGLGIAFIKTPSSDLPANVPDIEIIIGSGAVNVNTSGPAHRYVGLTDDFFYSTYKGILNVPAFQTSTVLLRPKSRGRIKLKSKNPFHWPLVVPNYLDVESDLKTLIEGLELTIKLTETPAFKEINATLNPAPYFGCEQHKFRSDEYWECCIRSVGVTWHHDVGTCRMGPSTDPDAVVDSELKIYGIEGIRVVDASIMPHVPAAHTNAIVIMIGEKGADIVKAHYNKL